MNNTTTTQHEFKSWIKVGFNGGDLVQVDVKITQHGPPEKHDAEFEITDITETGSDLDLFDKHQLDEILDEFFDSDYWAGIIENDAPEDLPDHDKREDHKMCYEDF